MGAAAIPGAHAAASRLLNNEASGITGAVMAPLGPLSVFDFKIQKSLRSGEKSMSSIPATLSSPTMFIPTPSYRRSDHEGEYG